MASTTRTAPPAADAALPDAAAPAGSPRLLSVRVGAHRYGVPLDAVREVLVAGPVTRLPGAPPHVLGLLNVRGRLVTVLDVARRLEPETSPGAGGHVLLVEATGVTAGCRVDAVLRAVAASTLPSAASSLPPGAGNVAAGGIVLGIGEAEGEPLVVLDLPRFVRESLVDPGER